MPYYRPVGENPIPRFQTIKATTISNGGRHHAAGRGASGFWVCNDTVVAIKHLHGRGRRVADVDIDGHHGDGVRDAFYDGPRALTIAAHELGRLCRRCRRLSRATSC